MPQGTAVRQGEADLRAQLKGERDRSQPNPFLVRELTQRKLQVEIRIFEVGCGAVR